MDLVRVSHITCGFRFGGLFDISFSVSPGERVALFGPPASGKSALLSLLAGHIRADEGEVEVCGRPLEESAPWIGFAQQSPCFKPSITPRRHILSALASHLVSLPQRRARLTEALHATGLSDLADRPVRELNYSAVLSLGIAAAIAHRPNMVLLDDTVCMLAPYQRAQLWKYLDDRRHIDGIAVIHATMDAEDAEAADRVMLMLNGRMLAFARPGALLDQCTREEIVVEAADADSIDSTLRGISEVEAISTPDGIRYSAKAGSEIAAHLFRHPISGMKGVFVRRPGLWDCFPSS